MTNKTIPIMQRPVDLGLFRLESHLGAGGMGQVWLGRHREQKLPVAVKVMTGEYARTPQLVTAFQNEVRSVSMLNHPGIVMVFDYGVIPRKAETDSGGQLVAGSPYLVMEAISGGALSSNPLPSTWTQLRSLLLATLDALAYAHARGVIHRDLKPPNVLIASESDVRPGLKLIDFGLSAAIQVDPGADEVAGGTPSYSAPEQILLSKRRDQGPWTDLYALGCMAYALACGFPPFRAASSSRVRDAHLTKPVPPLKPRIPIPDGFEGWIHRLMKKEPARRFQRASDAAHALLAIADGTVERGGAEVAFGDLESGKVTLPELLTLPSMELHSVVTEISAPSARDSSFSLRAQDSEVTGWVHELPPMPQTWRRGAEHHRSFKLIGVGLGLYGLRSIPLVGRESERDLIWQRLAETRELGYARAIVLHGPAGTGKSRLVEWVCERAHELGCAGSVRASHGPLAGLADGLPRMVSRHLNCVGLARGAIQRRLETLLYGQGIDDPYESRALTEVIHPASRGEDEDSRPLVEFHNREERYEVICRFLERAAKERPLIVWLDDVHYGADAIGLTRHLIERQARHPSPVLVLLTARQEFLAERMVEATLLQELEHSPLVESLKINPLRPEEHLDLIRSLIGLETRLAKRIRERTAGNPLFAVQLIGDWVKRGVLTVGEDGFTLRKGEDAVLPDDIHEVWTARIDRLLDEVASNHPSATAQSVRAQAETAMEIASCLGREVDSREWRTVCGQVSPSVMTQLSESLLASRLAEQSEFGWAFSHGMLRESLERRARDRGVWRDHNHRCADALELIYPGYPEAAERIGLHRLAGGQLQEALEPLYKAAARRLATSDVREAERLLDHRASALEQLGP
ncbi:MAG: protein kinase [Myxococcales bacterium]|nr:protein kinase [Myxococcales bacterium]